MSEHGQHFEVLGRGDGFIHIRHLVSGDIIRREAHDWPLSVLISLAPIRWWEQEFPKTSGGVDLYAALNWINRRAEAVPAYSGGAPVCGPSVINAVTGRNGPSMAAWLSSIPVGATARMPRHMDHRSVKSLAYTGDLGKFSIHKPRRGGGPDWTVQRLSRGPA